jgi:hypothetical protein
MFVCTYVCMYVCIYACAHASVYVCTLVCIYVYLVLATAPRREQLPRDLHVKHTVLSVVLPVWRGGAQSGKGLRCRRLNILYTISALL